MASSNWGETNPNAGQAAGVDNAVPSPIIEVRPDEEAPSLEGSERAARRSELEGTRHCVHLEVRTRMGAHPHMHNRGYDLYKDDQDGNVIRWCEVKAMTGTWDDRSGRR